ncbi:MAG TPA: hypothetical protein VF530_09085 [Planctomycetota bacterium]
MTRFDLYTHVHKALRALLLDALTTVGRTDFARESELPAAVANVRHALRLAHLHARHEDREIHPILQRLAPTVAADLDAAHVRFAGVDQGIEGLLARLGSATLAERVSLGRKLHQTLGVLVGEHLLHMNVEETQASRILWAHLTDEELVLLHGRILAAIEPAEMSEWVEWLLPAGHRGERAALLVGLESAVPAEALATVTAPGRRRLGEALWSEARAAARALTVAERTGASS